MTGSSVQLYHEYVEKMRRIADIRYAAAVLQWDQETYLPEKGNAGRARQLATLSETAHQLFSDASLSNLLNELLSKNGLDAKQKKNVELTLEDYTKQKKYSSEFVRKLSETVSEAFHAWISAKKQNDYKLFKPALEKLVALKKQESDILGYTDHPYNAHLKEYEKSTSVKQLDALFASLQKPLKELIASLTQKQANTSFFRAYYPKDKQWEWSLYLIRELGFDTEAGRQDISEHPFSTSFGAKDVRITTRIDEHDFANMNWSCIHEVGHALYEQGLPDEEYGLPSGEYSSLSIHESQSRLWENCIGRSKTFWSHYLPRLKEYFPEQLNNISADHFVQAIKKVQPSLIRTEADELTYHFHVMIRYEIEKDIISGELKAEDIPERWNGLYKQYLNIDVPDDRQGCLQDVHWSHGSFGYFPTYSLGSLYAAQFWSKLKKDEPLVEEEISKGVLTKVHNWLAKNVYCHGRLLTSEEIAQQITGEGLNTKYFIDYIVNSSPSNHGGDVS